MAGVCGQAVSINNNNKNAFQVVMRGNSSPTKAILSILVRSIYAMQLTIIHCNIVESRPRASCGTATLDLTKQNLLRQTTIRHPECIIYPPEYALFVSKDICACRLAVLKNAQSTDSSRSAICGRL